MKFRDWKNICLQTDVEKPVDAKVVQKHWDLRYSTLISRET